MDLEMLMGERGSRRDPAGMRPGRKLFLVMALGAAFWGWVSPSIARADDRENRAKYVFLFIGDGMGLAQRRAAELYLTVQGRPGAEQNARLVMNTLPAQGLADPSDLGSFIPDSASAATAMACGRKTRSGFLSMEADGKTRCETIAETAKKNGWKVGILSTVSLDHATPAAFYAHVPSRRLMEEIVLQLADS